MCACLNFKTFNTLYCDSQKNDLCSLRFCSFWLIEQYLNYQIFFKMSSFVKWYKSASVSNPPYLSPLKKGKKMLTTRKTQLKYEIFFQLNIFIAPFSGGFLVIVSRQVFFTLIGFKDQLNIPHEAVGGPPKHVGLLLQWDWRGQVYASQLGPCWSFKLQQTPVLIYRNVHLSNRVTSF